MRQSMVHCQRYHQWRKGTAHIYEEDEESHGLVVLDCANSACYKMKRPRIFYLLIVSLLYCSFVLAPQLFSSFTFSLSRECFHPLLSLSCAHYALVFSFVISSLMFCADTFGVDRGIPVDVDFNAPLCSSMSTG